MPSAERLVLFLKEKKKNKNRDEKRTLPITCRAVPLLYDPLLPVCCTYFPIPSLTFGFRLRLLRLRECHFSVLSPAQ